MSQLGVSLYVCENCHQLGTMSSFQGDCTPGWTHGRLTKIESIEVTDELVDWALLIFDEIDAAADPTSRTVREARASMLERLRALDTCRDERSDQALDRSSRRVGAKADQLTPRGLSGD